MVVSFIDVGNQSTWKKSPITGVDSKVRLWSFLSLSKMYG